MSEVKPPRAYRLQEVVDMIKEEQRKVDHSKVYFAMRSMKIKPITQNQVEIMKLCIALDKFMIPITTDVVRIIAEKKGQETNRVLHLLGDKHCLILIRNDIRSFRWKIDPLFSNFYSGKKET